MQLLKGCFEYVASSDRKYALDSGEKTIHLRDAQGNVISKFRASSYIRGPAISPDGSLAAAITSEGKNIYVFDLSKGEGLEQPLVIRTKMKWEEIDSGLIMLNDNSHIVFYAKKHQTRETGLYTNIVAYNFRTEKMTVLYREHGACQSVMFNEKRDECLVSITTYGEPERREARVGRLNFYAEGGEIRASYERIIVRKARNELWPGINVIYGTEEREIACISEKGVDIYTNEGREYQCVQHADLLKKTNGMTIGVYPFSDRNHVLIASNREAFLFSMREMRTLRLYKKALYSSFLLPSARCRCAPVLALVNDHVTVAPGKIIDIYMLVGEEQAFLDGEYDDYLERASTEEEAALDIKE